MEIYGLGGTATCLTFLLNLHRDLLVISFRSTSLRRRENKYADELCDKLERAVWVVTVRTKMTVRRHTDDPSMLR